jgi:hypothetical protein
MIEPDQSDYMTVGTTSSHYDKLITRKRTVVVEEDGGIIPFAHPTDVMLIENGKVHHAWA